MTFQKFHPVIPPMVLWQTWKCFNPVCIIYMPSVPNVYIVRSSFVNDMLLILKPRYSLTWSHCLSNEGMWLTLITTAAHPIVKCSPLKEYQHQALSRRPIQPAYWLDRTLFPKVLWVTLHLPPSPQPGQGTTMSLALESCPISYGSHLSTPTLGYPGRLPAASRPFPSRTAGYQWWRTDYLFSGMDTYRRWGPRCTPAVREVLCSCRSGGLWRRNEFVRSR